MRTIMRDSTEISRNMINLCMYIFRCLDIICNVFPVCQLVFFDDMLLRVVAVARDDSFSHRYGYLRVPYPKTMGMGKTSRDFVTMGNGNPYPQNIWVGYGYKILPMGKPMDIKKKSINENN